MLVFLDLEETVIDDWSSGLLLPENIAIIKQFFQTLNPTIGLMSWAVWHDHDKQTFNKKFRPDLENTLGMSFDDNFLWTMTDFANELHKHFGKKITQEDLFDIFSKQEVLFMLSQCHPAFTNNQIFLVDDTVIHDLQWFNPVNKCSVKMKNINTMRTNWDFSRN